jgi:amino acid transporter
MIFDGIVGFAMMVAVLYCLGNADMNTKLPFIQIFRNSVKSVNGAIGMSVVVLILTWGCSAGITTTASRMTWSFARDRGTPFSRHLSEVNQSTRVPVRAVFLVSIFAGLLVLIYIGSDAAFEDVISLTITGFYGSYFLPCALLLYHRVKGHILPCGSELTLGDLDEEDNPQLVWGPWHLPGIFGIINNAYACVYAVYVIFWSVWPRATPVSANTMNYSIVVTGGVLIVSGVWYMVKGRREYVGPIVEV